MAQNSGYTFHSFPTGQKYPALRELPPFQVSSKPLLLISPEQDQDQEQE
jgi:hypothetical protein